jgi:hypothetical protein
VGLRGGRCGDRDRACRTLQVCSSLCNTLTYGLTILSNCEKLSLFGALSGGPAARGGDVGSAISSLIAAAERGDRVSTRQSFFAYTAPESCNQEAF